MVYIISYFSSLPSILLINQDRSTLMSLPYLHPKVVILKQGDFGPPGDMWQCLETFIFVMTRGATGT